MWKMKCERWNVNDEMWKMKCERWNVNDEMWMMKCERWNVNDEMWMMKCEWWNVNDEMWMMKCERGNVNDEMWMRLFSLFYVQTFHVAVSMKHTQTIPKVFPCVGGLPTGDRTCFGWPCVGNGRSCFSLSVLGSPSALIQGLGVEIEVLLSFSWFEKNRRYLGFELSLIHISEPTRPP